MEFYSEQRAAEFGETGQAALLAEKKADEQAEVRFNTETEHLS